MEIDALYEHPEDGRLETEHEGGQHGVTEPGLSLVPDILARTFLLDVGSEVDWGEFSLIQMFSLALEKHERFKG